jgi:hypothetical protein
MKHWLTPITLLFLLGLIHRAVAQQDFSFEIEAAKDKHVLGEIVALTGKVTNVSDESQSLFRLQYRLWLNLSHDDKRFSRIPVGAGAG